MENTIEVSFFCATFNQEKYLRRCLESLVMQKTSFQYEILVHDDASSDGTVEIINEFVDKYPEIVKPLYQAENQYSKGVKITKKFQFPRANGKYIAFCEGDDYWNDSFKLQKQYDVMEKNASCVACVAKTKCCNEDESPNERTIPDKRVQIQTGLISAEKACSLIYSGYVFQTSSFFLKREVLETAYSQDYSEVVNGDEAYLMAAVSLGDFYFIDSELSTYRLNANGSWNESSRYWSRDKQIEHQMKIQNARFCFFNVTNKKFREQTISYLIHRCYIKDRKYLNEVLKCTGISLKEVYKQCDLKHRIIFFMIRYFPIAWNYYRDNKQL